MSTPLFNLPPTPPAAAALSDTRTLKPAAIKITCKDPAQLRQVQAQVVALLALHPGAYLSVSAGLL